MIRGMQSGGDGVNMEALEAMDAGSSGGGGIGGGIKDAMACWGHAKTLYAASTQASSQFCLFLCVYSFSRVCMLTPSLSAELGSTGTISQNTYATQEL